MTCRNERHTIAIGNDGLCPLRPSKRRNVCLEEGAEDMNPVSFVFREFKLQDYDTNDIIQKCDKEFIQPTPTMLEAYPETSRVVRDLDLDKLKELHKSGVPMLCSNRFGDNLVSIAARRGATNIVKFLVDEAKTSLYVRDDIDRTPLHDALWTAEPNFDLVKTLLQAAPELCLLRDKRGATPFDYIRPQHATVWMDFLYEHRSLLRPKNAKMSTAAKKNSKNPAAA